jgi:hypothetical protein
VLSSLSSLFPLPLVISTRSCPPFVALSSHPFPSLWRVAWCVFGSLVPKIKTSRTKPPPEGYEEIAPILEDYARKMRDAENESHEGKRRVESTWGIVSAPTSSSSTPSARSPSLSVSSGQ